MKKPAINRLREISVKHPYLVYRRPVSRATRKQAIYISSRSSIVNVKVTRTFGGKELSKCDENSNGHSYNGRRTMQTDAGVQCKEAYDTSETGSCRYCWVLTLVVDIRQPQHSHFGSLPRGPPARRRSAPLVSISEQVGGCLHRAVKI